MKQYHNLLTRILTHGVTSDDRTGVGTISLFGDETRYNLEEGFPAVTTKALAWKSVVSELLWMLEGSTDERRLAEILYKSDRKYLAEKKTIWTANADKQGVELGYQNNNYCKELGPVYGSQWRDFGQDPFGGKDQIVWLIDRIKKVPNCRRLILNAWDANSIDDMALPPCHVMAQFRVINGKLNCKMYQRSADCFLGVPFNIASYALLTHIIARECDLGVGDFIHSIGDAHIYLNHVNQVRLQLARTPMKLPVLKIAKEFSLADVLAGETQLKAVDLFGLEGYNCYESIKADMAA